MVGIWPVGLPLALLPLWQIVQFSPLLPEIFTLLWLNEVGTHQAVEWQVSQPLPPTGMCLAVTPLALTPLWQSAHFLAPIWTGVCANDVGVQPDWVWQTLHCSVVWICSVGLPVAVLLL